MITTHPHTVRKGGAASDALWKTRSLIEIQKTMQMVQREERQEVRETRSSAEGIIESNPRHEKVWTAHDQTHVEVPQRLFASSSSGVENSGPQSLRISEARCRAKLRGIFEVVQRQSKDGRFFLLLGVSDMLVANQIARRSSVGAVILSERLAPGIDLSSSVVRNMLRGWIAHGDVAGVWMTLSFVTVLAKPHESTAVCLLEACQQAGVVSRDSATT